jgi:hypothetical protein
MYMSLRRTYDLDQHLPAVRDHETEPAQLLRLLASRQAGDGNSTESVPKLKSKPRRRVSDVRAKISGDDRYRRVIIVTLSSLFKETINSFWPFVSRRYHHPLDVHGISPTSLISYALHMCKKT